jgi:hypothetical protein
MIIYLLTKYICTKLSGKAVDLGVACFGRAGGDKLIFYL